MKAVGTAVRCSSALWNRGECGEEVKKPRVISDEFIYMLESSYTTRPLVGEENDGAIPVEEERRGKYAVRFDPLDGLSIIIDCTASIGSVSAIYKCKDGYASEKDAPRPGNKIVAAGYALYDSATATVLALGYGTAVDGFMSDPTIGEFLSTGPDMKILRKGKIYSIDVSYSYMWDPATAEYIGDLKLGKSYCARIRGVHDC